MNILKSADFPIIRAAIDHTLDEVGLPDSIIAMSIYRGAGESAVLERDSLALNRIDVGDALYNATQATHIRNAAIFFTASLLVLALPQIQKETFGTHYAVQNQLLSRNELATSLNARAEAELDFILTPNIEDDMRPTFFSIGKRRTARSQVGKFFTPGEW